MTFFSTILAPFRALATTIRWILNLVELVIARTAQFIAGLFLFLFVVRVWTMTFRQTPPQNEDSDLSDVVFAVLGVTTTFGLVCAEYFGVAALVAGFCLGVAWPSDFYRRFTGRFRVGPDGTFWSPPSPRTEAQRWENLRRDYFGHRLWHHVRARCASDNQAYHVHGIFLTQDEPSLIRCLTDEEFRNARFFKAAKAYCRGEKKM